MRASFQLEPLESLCKVFTDGDWIESKDQSPGGIRLVQTGNIGCGEFKERGDKARYIAPETFARLRCDEIFQGDCLISRLPDPVGRACIIPEVKERMITAVDCSVARFDRARVLPEFFVYYSQSASYLSAIASRCTGTTRNRISRSQLGLLTIPVPPLIEQERIVDILDQAFESIGAASQMLKKSVASMSVLGDSAVDKQLQTYARDARRVALGNVADVQSGGTPAVSNKNYWSGRVAWYSSGELNEAKTVSPNRSITQQGLSNSNAKLFPAGSLLIGMYDTAAMKMSILDRDAAFNQAIAGVRPNQEIDLEYLLLFLTAKRTKILSERRGTRQKNLSLSKIKAIEIDLPSLGIQKQIVELLNGHKEQCRELTGVYLRKASSLDELKQSLLHAAFSGNL